MNYRITIRTQTKKRIRNPKFLRFTITAESLTETQTWAEKQLITGNMDNNEQSAQIVSVKSIAKKELCVLS